MPEELIEEQDVLSPQEIEDGVALGVLEGEGEEKPEEPETEPEAEPEVKSEGEEEKPVEDEDAKEFETVSEYTDKEKKSYWEMKKERKKRQEIEAENQLLRVKLEATKPRAEAEPEKKADPDDFVTFNDLEAQRAQDAEKQKQTEAEAAKLRDRWNDMEDEARDKDPNFDKMSELVQDVFKTNSYGSMYYTKLMEESTKEGGDPIGLMYHIAKQHPQYSSLAKPSVSKVAEKIENNANKPRSSASVGSSSGDLPVSEDDLTLDQASVLSLDEWRALKPETRKRLDNLLQRGG